MRPAVRHPLERRKMKINIGNKEGQYFTQWRFDELTSLAREFNNRLCVELEFDLFYDPIHDFHHLVFKHNGHDVNIRFYKVYSALLNGKEFWSACPRHSVWEMSGNLVKKLRTPATEQDKLLDFGKDKGINFSIYDDADVYLGETWQTSLPEIGSEVGIKGRIRSGSYQVTSKHKVKSIDQMNHKICVDKTPTWKAEQ